MEAAAGDLRVTENQIERTLCSRSSRATTVALISQDLTIALVQVYVSWRSGQKRKAVRIYRLRTVL
jgi:hypothetical protein